MTITNSDEVFRFFDLPPELREMIYEYLAEEEISIAQPEPHASLSIQDSPLTNVLLVNHETKSEYHKVAAKRTTLVFSDHETFNFTLMPVPTKLLNVTKISVRLFIVCEDHCPLDHTRCVAAQDLQQTVDLTQGIQYMMQHVNWIEVNLGLWCKEDEKFEWPNTPHRQDLIDVLYTQLIKVPRVSRIRVYRSPQKFMEAGKLVDETKILASWTKDDGWKS